MNLSETKLLELISLLIEESKKELPTNFFKIGDKILFGKYKNKKGTITGFGKDEKGNPTVKIKPIAKDGAKKKKDQEIGLYRIWDGGEGTNTSNSEEKLTESRRPEYTAGKGLKFLRYGGLTPNKQKNDAAPQTNGLWAFVYPYFDVWFLSGDKGSKDGRFKKDGTANKSLMKQFHYDGPVYSRINVPKSVDLDNGWFLTTSKALFEFLPKQYAKDLATMRKDKIFAVDNNESKDVYRFMSKDHFEVFIPANGKIAPRRNDKT
jgi:hypothetical protein